MIVGITRLILEKCIHYHFPLWIIEFDVSNFEEVDYSLGLLLLNLNINSGQWVIFWVNYIQNEKILNENNDIIMILIFQRGMWSNWKFLKKIPFHLILRNLFQHLKNLPKLLNWGTGNFDEAILSLPFNFHFLSALFFIIFFFYNTFFILIIAILNIQINKSEIIRYPILSSRCFNIPYMIFRDLCIIYSGNENFSMTKLIDEILQLFFQLKDILIGICLFVSYKQKKVQISENISKISNLTIEIMHCFPHLKFIKSKLNDLQKFLTRICAYLKYLQISVGFNSHLIIYLLHYVLKYHLYWVGGYYIKININLDTSWDTGGIQM
ncbi:hypothetical protein VP01_4545g1 [Puccinia sorghi]|uniref:Uncharacterized protein n=1 Tax=Puccinia sorghi TaxID=27349 RepID=A0A0L6UPM4_9BASI|nr:hypothetical protein VP01_4545g1 [Puccinia sorghi]